MRKLITILIVIALGGAGAWFLLSPKAAAPSVTFETLDDKQIPLQDFNGKVVLVKFWATSCVTCVKQMPDTVELYNTYHPQGLEVVAVAMDYDPLPYVKQFAASRELPFIVATDKNGAVAKAFDDVKLTPIAFLIDRNGQIVKRYLGVYDKQDMKNKIEAALTS
jgi:peroxiredoxin